MKKRFIKWLSVILAAATLGIEASAAAGIGQVNKEEKKNLACNTLLSYSESSAPKGNLKTFTLSGNFKDIEIVPYYGRYARSLDTLSELVSKALSEGLEVIGAVNADFFYGSGLSRGATVKDSEIICGTGGLKEGNFQDLNWRMLGIKDNGTVLLNTVKTTGKIEIGGQNYELQNINRPCYKNGFTLFTEKYSTETNEKDSNYSIVMKLVNGKCKAGEICEAEVKEILPDSASVPLCKGETVLTALKNGNEDFLKILSKIKVGDKIRISLGYSLPEFNGVRNLIGTPDFLIKNNQILPMGGLWMQYSENYPSSAVGFKADGSVIMFQADGRNSGGSCGIHPRLVAQYFKEKGCNNAVMFDGGGSSEMVIVESGKIKVLNKPSDGHERKISNALLMVKRTHPFIDNNPVKPDEPQQPQGGNPESRPPISGNSTGNNDKHKPTQTEDSESKIKFGGTDSPKEGQSESNQENKGYKEIEYPENGILKSRYLRKIKGLKKTLLVNRKENEQFKYSVEIFGRDIIKAQDINLEIKTESDIINKLKKEKRLKNGIALDFNIENDILSKAKIVYSLNENGLNENKLNIYCYNRKNGRAKEIARDINITDGKIEFTAESFDTVILTEDTLENIGSAKSHSKRNGIILAVVITVLSAAVIALAVTALLKFRNNKGDKK